MSGDPIVGGNQAACGCWQGAWWGVNPPPRCAMHSGGWIPVATQWPTYAPIAPPMVYVPRLADEDVERIAKRVAELLREPK